LKTISDGNSNGMTEPSEANDIVDDGVSDVLDTEVVHVPAAAAELAESIEHHHDSTFVADVANWDEPDTEQ
jgi:hypothetical protein